ncbi:hypothetical protein ACROYT_G022733 [Oculina patagonica]
MDSRRIAVAVFILVSVSHVGRSQECCDYRPWSSWSSCDYPCGTDGTESRSKINEGCYEECNDLQETRRCTGILPVNCELSSWSYWSSCSVDGRCDFSSIQTSTRRKVRMEGCGGTCYDADYEKTRQCACLNEGTPDVNGTCQCKEDYYGACCEEIKVSSWQKGWLGFLAFLILFCCCYCYEKDSSSVGPQ